MWALTDMVLQWCYKGVTMVLQWCYNRGESTHRHGVGLSAPELPHTVIVEASLNGNNDDNGDDGGDNDNGAGGDCGCIVFV
jgi:hypothetical protein